MLHDLWSECCMIYEVNVAWSMKWMLHDLWSECCMIYEVNVAWYMKWMLHDMWSKCWHIYTWYIKQKDFLLNNIFYVVSIRAACLHGILCTKNFLRNHILSYSSNTTLMTLPAFPSPIAFEKVSWRRSFLMLEDLEMPVKVQRPIEKFPKY